MQFSAFEPEFFALARSRADINELKAEKAKAVAGGAQIDEETGEVIILPPQLLEVRNLFISNL